MNRILASNGAVSAIHMMVTTNRIDMPRMLLAFEQLLRIVLLRIKGKQSVALFEESTEKQVARVRQL